MHSQSLLRRCGGIRSARPLRDDCRAVGARKAFIRVGFCRVSDPRADRRVLLSAYGWSAYRNRIGRVCRRERICPGCRREGRQPYGDCEHGDHVQLTMFHIRRSMRIARRGRLGCDLRTLDCLLQSNRRDDRLSKKSRLISTSTAETRRSWSRPTWRTAPAGAMAASIPICPEVFRPCPWDLPACCVVRRSAPAQWLFRA